MPIERTAALCLGLALLTNGCRPENGQAFAAVTPSQVACVEASPTSGETGRVVAAAQAFARSLNERQRDDLQHPLELQYAIRWSNFPSPLVRRNGVAFGDMNPSQVAAAKALILAAAGACGARMFDENRGADVLGQRVVSTVNPAMHYISFNGTPSATRPWMLMVSGHHLDYNFVFNGPEAGATPLFAGTDPATYTDAEGVTHNAMARQGAALSRVAQAASRFPEGHLPGVFTDLTKSVASFGDPASGGPPPSAAGDAGPRPAAGGGPPRGPNFGIDVHYPQTYSTQPADRGVNYARLTPAEQAAVRDAILAYAALPGRQISAPLVKAYLDPKALAQTYVSYSGDPALVKPNAYVRIDGPRVWIELSVQTSLYDKAATHFHSLWRDKISDYGGEFRTAARS